MHLVIAAARCTVQLTVMGIVLVPVLESESIWLVMGLSGPRPYPDSLGHAAALAHGAHDALRWEEARAASSARSVAAPARQL